VTGETITIDEVVSLLKQLAARDQRTTGDADVLAWYGDLNAVYVTYRDAQAAATHYYTAIWPRQKPIERHRLTASLVIELVGKMRDERIANFVYQPTPGETGAEYVENYNRQLQAVASGEREPAPSISEALKPRPVAELVAGIAARKALPPEIAEVIERRRPAGTEVRCPHCGAEPRQRCRVLSGRHGIRELSTIHPSRLEAAGGAQ